MEVPQFKTYTTSKGETLLYTGFPNLNMLNELADGAGDLWHSSLDQGYLNCFSELIYQTATYWFFLNDFEGVHQAVNWRINHESFVVRESVWNDIGGFDVHYEESDILGLDLGFRFLRYQTAIPLYKKGLYKSSSKEVKISVNDRYRFFAKFFKKRHNLYMLYRKMGFSIFKEYFAYNKAKSVTPFVPKKLKTRVLNEIEGKPTVSVVIPTMKRQKYTELLLQDYKNQTYPITEVVIVDATPEKERDLQYYNQLNYDYEIKLKWQTTKGSCRARNEAIELCTGDYIIFADDDVRILPDFVEKHIKLLQTYKASASNGLDIMAKHPDQNLDDLKVRLKELEPTRWHVGVSHMFSNANSCVKRSLVNELKGNDVNFDGGYGEDSDFGFRILKSGHVLLFNPFSPNLHLKPIEGGYRFWGAQSKLMGKKRKEQPWELDNPVKHIRPVPSPTITYGIIKHFETDQVRAWRHKHFFLYLFKGRIVQFPLRLIKLPYKQIQFNKSLLYAKRLLNLGSRYS